MSQSKQKLEVQTRQTQLRPNIVLASSTSVFSNQQNDEINTLHISNDFVNKISESEVIKKFSDAVVQNPALENNAIEDISLPPSRVVALPNPSRTILQIGEDSFTFSSSLLSPKKLQIEPGSLIQELPLASLPEADELKAPEITTDTPQILKKLTLNYFGQIDGNIGQMQTQMHLPFRNHKKIKQPSEQQVFVNTNFYQKIQFEPQVVHSYSRPRGLAIFKPESSVYQSAIKNCNPIGVALQLDKNFQQKKRPPKVQSGWVEKELLLVKKKKTMLQDLIVTAKGKDLELPLFQNPTPFKVSAVSFSDIHHYFIQNRPLTNTNQDLSKTEHKHIVKIKRIKRVSNTSKMQNDLQEIKLATKLRVPSKLETINKKLKLGECRSFTQLRLQINETPTIQATEEEYLQYLKFKKDVTEKIKYQLHLQEKLGKILQKKTI